MKDGLTLNGTPHDDFCFIFDGTSEVTARKGDDKIVFASDTNVIVDGGFGYDRFDFYFLSTQRLKINEIDDDKTVLKIFENGERVLKIVLHDIEDIDWTIEKGAPLHLPETRDF